MLIVFLYHFATVHEKSTKLEKNTVHCKTLVYFATCFVSILLEMRRFFFTFHKFIDYAPFVDLIVCKLSGKCSTFFKQWCKLPKSLELAT